jgi:hypothetical protein
MKAYPLGLVVTVGGVSVIAIMMLQPSPEVPPGCEVKLAPEPMRNSDRVEMLVAALPPDVPTSKPRVQPVVCVLMEVEVDSSPAARCRRVSFAVSRPDMVRAAGAPVALLVCGVA